jgi:hypothetical protein
MGSVRSDARLVGALLVCVGVWGGIVAFVGPTFSFETRGTLTAWVWNQSHAVLFLVPSVGAILGGLLLMGSTRWVAERMGAFLALLSGIWFVIAPSLEPLWNTNSVNGSGSLGVSGSNTIRALETIGYSYGTGAAIVLLASFALGLLALVPALVQLSQPAGGPGTEPATARTTFRHASHA